MQSRRQEKIIKLKIQQFGEKNATKRNETTQRCKSPNHFISLVNVAINILEMLSTGQRSSGKDMTL